MIDLNLLLLILLWWVIGFLTSLGNELEKSGKNEKNGNQESPKFYSQNITRKSLIKHFMLGLAGPVLLIYRVFFRK